MSADTAGSSGPASQAPGAALFAYVLSLADDALVLGHRLSEWSGRGPTLEEDIALSNLALDLIGQARLCYAYAGEIEGRGRDEDALAYCRDEHAYRNLLLRRAAEWRLCHDHGAPPAVRGLPRSLF